MSDTTISTFSRTLRLRFGILGDSKFLYAITKMCLFLVDLKKKTMFTREITIRVVVNVPCSFRGKLKLGLDNLSFRSQLKRKSLRVLRWNVLTRSEIVLKRICECVRRFFKHKRGSMAAARTRGEKKKKFFFFIIFASTR